MGRIAVTGSVAYDTIMVFPGRFADHILPERTHLINVSFLVDRLERRRGGTASNIAYTLALLGERPLLCAAVGADYDTDAAALAATGVDVSAALRCDDVPTAGAFITTDLDDNQITAFHPGAMARAIAIDLSGLRDVDTVVISPNAPDAMAAQAIQAVEMGARLVFAPAQQLPSLDPAIVARCLDAAWMVVGNDYEIEMIREKTGREVSALGSADCLTVRTLGGQGSELHCRGTVERVPVCAVERLLDPTGAGDAYLAGMLAALRAGDPPATAARVGAVAAAFVVERNGTQEHHYSRGEFATRYRAAFAGTESLVAV